MDGVPGSSLRDEYGEQSGVGVSAVLVVGLTFVHLAMAYSISTLPDLVYQLVEPIGGDSTAMLVVDIMPSMPLALVVLAVGRSTLRGALACVVVVVFAVLAHAAHDPPVIAALVVFGAVAAWGVARRRGTWWMAGLVVAPLLSQLVRWRDPDVFEGDVALHATFLAFVLHVVPAVIGGLVCWGLEWWQERR